MTTVSNELPVYELVGQVMTDLGAHYEILILRFGEYEIHVSCFARIIHNGKILLTTQDYQSWEKKTTSTMICTSTLQNTVQH